MIIGIDVGVESGLCVYNKSFTNIEYAKCKDLMCFFEFVESNIKKYKPKVIVTAEPTNKRNIIKSQFKKIGIIEYLCCKHKVKMIPIIDSPAKSSVIGYGDADKEEIITWANSLSGFDVNEHQADSMMFVQYLINNYLETVD